MGIAKYVVRLEFLNSIHGGIPFVDEETTPEEREARYGTWVGKQAGDARPEFRDTTGVEAVAEELATDDTMPTTDDLNVALNGFRSLDGVRPVIETRQVKAMIREAMQRTGLIKQFQMKQVIQHDVSVRALDGGDFLDLGVEAVTGIIERPIHVQTPQGPRTAIAMNEYIDGATLEFVVNVFTGGVAKETLTEARLRQCMEYAQEFSALGANRSQGFGRFTVKEITHAN